MPEIAINYWFWLSLGLILVVVEMVVPGVFFLWFGIGAFITGIVALIFKGIAIKYLTAIFAVFSLIAVFFGRKYFKKTDVKNGLNDSNAKYFGRKVKAEGAFENGHGRVLMGDTSWEAVSDENISAGQLLYVSGVQDSILKVSSQKNSSVAPSGPADSSSSEQVAAVK